MKKLLVFLLAVAMATTLLCSCGTNGDNKPNNNEQNNHSNAGSINANAKADESLFEWEGNLITGITSDGAKQSSILVPARCEGFSGVIFQETDIEHVAFEDDDDITLDFAFMGAEKIVSVKLPANLTVIPGMCFQGCKNLRAISIPATVTTLEGYAFSACSSLETLTFEGTGLTMIGENSFENCSSIKSVTIPDGVTTIEKYAFANCTSMKDITLSVTVKTIAKFAFGNTGAAEIHMPEDIQFDVIDASAFGTNAYTTVVYIVKDSWCDQNQSVWNIGFSEIKYE